jgi:NADH-quinone oxidoreductase subunit M
MLESISYQQSIGFPLLSFIIFLPTIGAILLLAFNSKKHGLIRSFAFLVAMVDFLFSLLLLPNFQRGVAHFQFVEKIDWIPAIGASYHVGVDGISLLLVLLSSFLGPIVILSTWKAINTQVKEFMICLLLLQTFVLGVFTSLDALLFYLFFEAQLVPMYLIIGIWGGGRRIYSALKFFIYTLVGSLPMVLGLLGIYFNYHNYAMTHGLTSLYTFSLPELFNVPVVPQLQMWIFWALFIGFAIKVPMFPFHTWLPDAHTDAPTAGSVVLAGILLKMGTYGFVRFSLPLLPDATNRFAPIVIALSSIAILYGAWLAMNQDDMKKLIAYSSVSHMGYITLGIFVLNTRGLTGGVLQMINHGLSTGALFLLVGVIYERRHTRLIKEFGGLFKQMPIYTAFVVIAIFSSMGAPGLNGFVGEIMVLMGAYQLNPMLTIIAVLGVLGCAAYLLWMFQQAFLGKITNPENKLIKDLSGREIMVMLPIVLMIFWIGLSPKPFINIIQPSAEYVVGKTNLPSRIQQPVNQAIEKRDAKTKLSYYEEQVDEHRSIVD